LINYIHLNKKNNIKIYTLFNNNNKSITKYNKSTNKSIYTKLNYSNHLKTTINHPLTPFYNPSNPSKINCINLIY